MILAETHFETETVTESNSDGKSLYIRGVFAQTNTPNRNKRIYPDQIFDPAAQSFVESMVKTNRALAELDHPIDGRNSIDATKACMLITEFEKDGNNYIGKAKILEGVPYGDIVAGLLRNGVQLGVSTRGTGSVKLNKAGINEVQSGYKLATIDAVLNPSGIDCFVSSLVENEQFLDLLSNRVLLEEFDRFLGARKAIMESNSNSRYDKSVAAFTNLLKAIKI